MRSNQSDRSQIGMWFVLPLNIAYAPQRAKEAGHVPLLDYYEGCDPEIVLQELAMMRRAGVEFITFSKCPPAAFEGDRWTHLFMKALELQPADERPLKGCIILEDYCKSPNAEEAKKAADYIYANWAQQDYYFRYRGKPLLLIFWDPKRLEPGWADWQEDRFTVLFFQDREKGGEGWSAWGSYPKTESKCWMTAMPGADNTVERAMAQATVLERADVLDEDKQLVMTPTVYGRGDGEFFRKSLEYAWQKQPDIVYVLTWNDWVSGTHVEPSKEDGYLYVDIMADVVGAADPKKDPLQVDKQLVSRLQTELDLITERICTHNYRYFRKTIRVGKDISKASLEIAAQDAYRLFINGKLVARENRGWTKIGNIDISEHLLVGDNVIAVEVDDWGKFIYLVFAVVKGAAGLILSGSIEHDDGERTEFVSDGTWKISAEAEQSWTECDFSDAAWPNASVLGKASDPRWEILHKGFNDGRANWIWSDKQDTAQRRISDGR